MTKIEFAKCMAYITAGIGKALAKDSLDVYFDLLGDLPVDVLEVACKRVIVEHPWNTFPSVAELRQAAADTVRGRVVALSAGEAWKLAWHAVGRIDPGVEGSMERGMKNIPPLVAEAMRCMGVVSMCCGEEPVAVIRAQFVKTFEQLSHRDARTALLPEKVKEAIEANAPAIQQEKIQEQLADIGKRVE